MKQYIIKNLEPLLIGFLASMLTIYFTNTISELVLKIALINSK